MSPVPIVLSCSTKCCRTLRRFRGRSKPWLKSRMAHLADVLVPPNEEGTRATILRWCKQVGDTVVKDEPLLELETDKVTVEIPAPADGTLVEVLKQVDAEVIPDEVLARLSLRLEAAPIEDTAPAPAPASAAAAAPASAASAAPASAASAA